MTVSHTPGPWESSAPGTQAIHYRGQDVATVHCGNKAWKANARLIAAAPEMLEALRLCAQFVGGAGLNDGIGNTLADGTVECLKRHEAAELIRAAIAKATLP